MPLNPPRGFFALRAARMSGRDFVSKSTAPQRSGLP